MGKMMQTVIVKGTTLSHVTNKKREMRSQSWNGWDCNAVCQLPSPKPDSPSLHTATMLWACSCAACSSSRTFRYTIVIEMPFDCDSRMGCFRNVRSGISFAMALVSLRFFGERSHVTSQREPLVSSFGFGRQLIRWQSVIDARRLQSIDNRSKIELTGRGWRNRRSGP